MISSKMKYSILTCLLLSSIFVCKTNSYELFLENGIEGVYVVQNFSKVVADKLSDFSTSLALIEYQHLLVDDEEINDKTIGRCILSCVGRRRRRRRSLQSMSRTFRCLGNLISTNYVLTAASCVKYTGDYKPISVRLADRRDIEIDEIIIHEDYRVNIPENTLDNDGNNIALIKLKQIVMFSSQVSPICLSYAKQDHLTPDLVSIDWQLTINDTLFSDLNHNQAPPIGDCQDKHGFEVTPAHVYGRGPMLAESCGGWTAGKRRGTNSFKYLISMKTRGFSCDASGLEIETVIGDYVGWIHAQIESRNITHEQ